MIAARLERGELIVDDAAGEVLRGHAEVLLSSGGLLSTREHAGSVVLDVERGRADSVVVRLRFTNVEGGCVRVEELRPLVAPEGYRGLPLNSLRIRQIGWQSWSRSHPPAPFAANLQTAAPPIRGPRLPHRHEDSQVEPWMTTLQGPGGAALLLGFTSAHRQLALVEIVPHAHGEGHSILAATELEGIPVAPGGDLVSEPILICTGPETDLVEHYAQCIARNMGAQTPSDIVTGWCSWYQLYTNVTEADVLRNLESLAARRDLLPLRLVQLDDGYQHAVGDWLELNDKFPRGLRWLVELIHHEGYRAGVWLAPFLLSAESHTFSAHPEWIVRDENNEPMNAIDNWGSANYALDTTHPAAMEWLEHVIHVVCDEWGFDYLKLDFLYAGAMRGKRFDPQLTGNAAYRGGMERLVRAAGNRFILGCGAPLVPSVGVVDGMRIGSDVAAFWGREGNADGPSLRNATRATLARLWLHERWWLNDPDCVVIRADDTQLSLAEVQAWAAVVALSGGMLFIGDDVSRVDESRIKLLARLLPPSGKAAVASGPLVEMMPEHLHLPFHRERASCSVVGIANWSDVTRSVVFDPADFGLTSEPLHIVDQWTSEYLGCHIGRVELGSLAPHALRLLAVHPDVGRPQCVGSTGHLLGAAMDLADEKWDESARALTLVPRTDGPPARRGELLVFDPAGPLRRVPFSPGDPSITLNFP